jgi:hypothetical protein
VVSTRSQKPNIDAAQSRWRLTASQLAQLTSLCREFSLAVSAGDLTLINGTWYVTHAGLLGLAARSNCVGIWARPVKYFCNAESKFWVFKATVFKSAKCKGFDGFGDACPANVSELVRGAEMRVAETRAVNRALRKAYGIGLCSVEEMGSSAASELRPGPVLVRSQSSATAPSSPTRNKLFELIRRHQLDAKLVKTYAEDFCGIGDLRHADRAAVTRFVENLASWATRDRVGLVAHLERYGRETRTSQ